MWTRSRAEAFAVAGVEAIFVLTSTDTFRTIQRATNRCGSVGPVRKLASILIHEEMHVRHGAGEREAYEAQLSTLAWLGASPGSALYAAVARSMRAAVAAPGPAPVTTGGSDQAGVSSSTMAGRLSTGR